MKSLPLSVKNVIAGRRMDNRIVIVFIVVVAVVVVLAIINI